MTVVKIKKQNDTKKCVIKRKLKFENFKNCLQETELENIINHLEKNKIDIDSLKKDHQKFVRNNKSILTLLTLILTLILSPPPCWFSLNNLETVEGVTLAFAAFSNNSTKTSVSHLVSLTRPSH